LWFFTQPICALSCDLLLFPARCRHDLDRPTVPWRRPPRNLPRIVEFLTVPSKNHTTKFMEKRPTLCFSSVSLFFPFPGAQKKRSRSLVIKLVKLWLLKLWLQVSKIRLFSPDFQNDSDWVMSYGSGSKINVSSSLATVVSQTRF